MKRRTIGILAAVGVSAAILVGFTNNTSIRTKYTVRAYQGGQYSANVINTWTTYGPIHREEGFCSFTDTKGKQVILSGTIVIEGK